MQEQAIHFSKSPRELISLEALEWIVITNYNDALAAVIRGEVDYALQGTEQNYTIKNVNKDNVAIMAYMSDIMPNYSCCRMLTRC